MVRFFKGSVIDILAIVVQLFSLFMLLFASYGILAPMFSNGTVTAGISSDDKNQLEATFYGTDYIVPFIFFMFSIISIISALRIAVNPVLYIFVLFIIICMVVFGHIFQEVFAQILASDAIIDGKPTTYFRQRFPMTSFVFDNLTNLSLGMLTAVAIATYAGSKISM